MRLPQTWVLCTMQQIASESSRVELDRVELERWRGFLLQKFVTPVVSTVSLSELYPKLSLPCLLIVLKSKSRVAKAAMAA